MILTASCQSCGAAIEHEDWQLGQNADCPACGRVTFLSSVKVAGPATARRPSDHLWLKIVIGSIGVILLIVIAMFADRGGATDEVAIGIFSGTIGVIELVCAIWVFILTVFWTIFPIFVYRLLNNVVTELKKIEQNTRRQ